MCIQNMKMPKDIDRIAAIITLFSVAFYSILFYTETRCVCRGTQSPLENNFSELSGIIQEHKAASRQRSQRRPSLQPRAPGVSSTAHRGVPLISILLRKIKMTGIYETYITPVNYAAPLICKIKCRFLQLAVLDRLPSLRKCIYAGIN